MFNISKEALERLRKEYTVGCRVELTKMNDPYRPDLVPGCKGTVTGVDDAGSIHVRWDIGSSLAVVYGEDACKKLDVRFTVPPRSLCGDNGAMIAVAGCFEYLKGNK